MALTDKQKDRLKKFLAHVKGAPESEEARTAAVMACQMIEEHGLVGQPSGVSLMEHSIVQSMARQNADAANRASAEAERLRKLLMERNIRIEALQRSCAVAESKALEQQQQRITAERRLQEEIRRQGAPPANVPVPEHKVAEPAGPEPKNPYLTFVVITDAKVTARCDSCGHPYSAGELIAWSSELSRGAHTTEPCRGRLDKASKKHFYRDEQKRTVTGSGPPRPMNPRARVGTSGSPLGDLIAEQLDQELGAEAAKVFNDLFSQQGPIYSNAATDTIKWDRWTPYDDRSDPFRAMNEAIRKGGVKPKP